jgi:hypothetical protein
MLGGPAHLTQIVVAPGEARNAIRWPSSDDPATWDVETYRFERIALPPVGYVEVLAHESLSTDAEILALMWEWVLTNVPGGVIVNPTDRGGS